MKTTLKKLLIMAMLFGVVLTTMGASSSVIYDRTTRNVSPTNLNVTAASVTTSNFSVTDMTVVTATIDNATTTAFNATTGYVTNLTIVSNSVYLADIRFTDVTQTKDRLYIRNTAKALTDATATALFTIVSRTNNFVGGTIDYSVFCQDAALETQVVGGIVSYSAINTNGGWPTLNIVENASNQSKAVTSGTIVPTWSLVAADAPNGVTNATVKVSVDTSLTPATGQFYILWQLRSNGTNSITPL